MITITMVLITILAFLNIIEFLSINKQLNSISFKSKTEKSFEETVLEIDNYLMKDRQVIVDKLNEARNIHHELVEEQHFYDDKINELNKKFKMGVSVDESDELSALYDMYNTERKEVLIECKKYKQDASHLSHILSIIDAKLV